MSLNNTVSFINSCPLFQYSPVIDSIAHVHHILVYICAGLNATEVNNSAPCIGNVGESLDECRGGEIIASWAVGGGVSSVACLVTKHPAFKMRVYIGVRICTRVLQDFIYPKNVAYPIGGPGNARFLVMEIHYDNPNLRSGMLVRLSSH